MIGSPQSLALLISYLNHCRANTRLNYQPVGHESFSRSTIHPVYYRGCRLPPSCTTAQDNATAPRYASDQIRFFKEHPESGDEIEQTDSRSILALKAENDIIYLLGSIPMRTRFGIDLRNDDIMVGLFHDSARVRLETTSNAAIAQRQLGPYAEQEIILPWAQILLGLRADYFSFDVENRLRQRTQPEGIAQKLLLSPKASVAVPINDDAAAAWMLNLESEFVYIGDEGSTEASGRTHREGIDLELRINPVRWLALGADATISRGRSVDDPEGENYIPLAPNLTISGNALFHLDNFSAATRLRLVGDRPANADNSVRAKGYGIVDLSASYKLGMAELFVNVENLLNAEWNEAQFDTESRLRGEAAPIDELHFTAGTPRSIRSGVAVRF
ncbi:MAG: TonB-dependent receptor [Bacteroidota bacterium]